MSGKMLILLGLVASVALMYFCIDGKKDALYAQLNDINVPTSAVAADIPKVVKKETPMPVVMDNQKAPSFAYVAGNKEKIAGFLSTQDEKSDIITQIDAICKDDSCIKELQFFEEVKPFAFTKETFELISYAKEKNITDFSLMMNKDVLKVEGTLTSKEQEEAIKPYFNAFINQDYRIENLMQIKKLTPLVKEEVFKEEATQDVAKSELVTPEHISIEDASKNINEIINENAITFDYKSSTISKESKQTLDEVIDILFGLDGVDIEVAGYTDSKGGTIYNKVLSQKRADSVRNYIIKSGIRARLLKSVGYGEENPIAAPKEIINRRVEIHLSEGK